MNKEIKSLTGIRGIAALWVVCMHYLVTIDLGRDLYIGKVFFNGFVAVDLFFLLSAFVMCLAYSNEFQKLISISSYKEFMKKRFARIYPAYFFWMFMFLCFEFIKLDFDYYRIAVNILLIQNFFSDAVISSVFWSLCSEWILYMIFPFLYSVIYKIRFNYINMSLILICIVGIYTLPLMNNCFIDFRNGLSIMPPTGHVEVVGGVNSIVRCLFSYVIGINLFILIKDCIINYSWVRALKYLAVIGILAISFFGKSEETYVLIFICLIVLIATLYLGKLKDDLFLASKAVYFLGQISYSIYLCHMFILISMSIFLKKFFSIQFDNATQIYLLIGSVVLLIPVSYLSYRFVEVKTGLWLKSKLFLKSFKK